MSDGLREKKKMQTREALIKSALRLFAKKGYAATTIEDITKKANCSPRTFFQYFESKEDLLLIGIDRQWDDLRQVLLKRPADTTTLDVLQHWAIAIANEFEAHESFLPDLTNHATASYLSAKAKRELFSMKAMEAILLPELAKDLRMQSTDTEPKMIAVAAAALFSAIHDPNLIQTDKVNYIKKAILMLKRLSSQL